MLDKDVIDDFKSQVLEAVAQLDSAQDFISRGEITSDLFVICGQVADRLYGASAMLGYKEISKYLQTMKFVFYKCAQSESEVAQQKVHELIRALSTSMSFIAENLHREEELKKIFFKIGLYRKKGDKLLQSYFFSIKDSSVGYQQEQEVVLVFDKSCRLEMLAKEVNQTLYPVLKYYNAPQGFKKELQITGDKIVGVVVDTECSSNIWMDLLRECQLARPAVPIMMVAKDPKSLDAFDKASLGIKLIVPRTISPSGILDKFKNYRPDEDRTNLPVSPNVLNGGVQNYLAISRSLFTLCNHSHFDLYVRVGEKFIKVVAQGESISDEQQQNTDGEFYITKDQYLAYSKLVDQEVAKFWTKNDLDFGSKKIHFDDFTSEIVENLMNLNVAGERIDQAKVVLKQSEHLLTELMLRKQAVKELVLDLSMFEHSVSVALIVGLFLKEIDAKGVVFEEIFIAALLHDLGLYDASEATKSEDLQQMKADEQTIFYAHPKRGAELAKEMGLKPVLCDAIATHHQRLSGEGFPSVEKGKSLVVNRIGELIGVAEELIYLVNHADDSILPTEALRLKLTDCFSPTIKAAYHKVFPPM